MSSINNVHSLGPIFSKRPVKDDDVSKEVEDDVVVKDVDVEEVEIVEKDQQKVVPKPVDKDVQEADVSRRRGSLRRAEAAQVNNHANYGQVTAQQMHLVHQFQEGELSADDLRTQFLDLANSKLDVLVSEGKLTEDEKAARIAKFTDFINRLIENLSNNE